MKIGYIGVSSSEQNLSRQIKIMKGNGIIKVFSERKSGENYEGYVFIATQLYCTK